MPPTALFDHPTPRQLLSFLGTDESDKSDERAQSTSNSSNSSDDSDLFAIVSMSCRMPTAPGRTSARDPEELYAALCGDIRTDDIQGNILRDKTSASIAAAGSVNRSNNTSNTGNTHNTPPLDATTDVPSVWDCQTRRACFLDEHTAEAFDPSFFGLSLDEASNMNPHQRLLLEVGHEALVQAGCVSETRAVGEAPLLKNTGVYVGMCNNEWPAVLAQRSNDGCNLTNPYAGVHGAQAATANYVSALI